MVVLFVCAGILAGIMFLLYRVSPSVAAAGVALDFFQTLSVLG